MHPFFAAFAAQKRRFEGRNSTICDDTTTTTTGSRVNPPPGSISRQSSFTTSSSQSTAFLANLPPVTDEDAPSRSKNGRPETSPDTFTNDLILFYTHPSGGHDSEGRTLSQILAFPDSKLESLHNYIQWLFPLPEASIFNRSAPVVDSATASAFRSRLTLRRRLREAFVRMLSFYGFELIDDASGKVEVVLAEDFVACARNWVRTYDHNHLRITRIIRCLRVLGLEAEAKAFHDALVSVGNRVKGKRAISAASLIFWSRAMNRPLQYAPDDLYLDDDEEEEEEDEEQHGFLGDYENGEPQNTANEDCDTDSIDSDITERDLETPPQKRKLDEESDDEFPAKKSRKLVDGDLETENCGREI